VRFFGVGAGVGIGTGRRGGERVGIFITSFRIKIEKQHNSDEEDRNAPFENISSNSLLISIQFHLPPFYPFPFLLPLDSGVEVHLVRNAERRLAWRSEL
jgi:hypothetical protein